MGQECNCCSPENHETDHCLKNYWDETFTKDSKKLGWYEENPQPSIDLIQKSGIKKDARQLHVGVGTSTLIESLLNKGFTNIVASDISSNAIQKLKESLGEKSKNVDFIIDNLTDPIELNKIDKVDLWHDRAVLHFFNEKHEQDAYFDLLKRVLNPNGHVIIAAFNLNGATKCNGLYLFRYNQEMIQKRLGDNFELMEAFDYTYTNPFGDTREYIYTLFKRTI